MFRAGTSSRLKRLGLFRSCRREASPKTQGLSEDASHHAREHKTPTEGTAHGIHRSVPGNPLFRHSKFFPFPRKGCCPSAEKVFGSTPFSKGVAGCRAGSPARNAGVQGGDPAKSIKTGCRAGSLQGTLVCRAGSSARSAGCGEYRQKEDVCPLTKVGRHCKIEVGIISEFL